MNLRQSITVVVTALLMLAGLSSCGSSKSTHLMYVSSGQGIYAFRINNGSGSPTSIFTAPFIIGNGPAGMVITPSGQFLYVANQLDGTISQLKIDAASGNLTEIMPRTQAGLSPNAMVIDSSGSTLFVANQLSNNVSVFSVSSGGALKLVSTAPVGAQPTALALAKNLLFVAVPTFSRVYEFTESAGMLTPVNGSPFFISNGVASVSVDPGAKFLYVPNHATNTISGFSLGSGGGLTVITGSPFAPTGTTLPTSPVFAAFDAAVTHLYVANFGSADVSQFSIGTNGELTSLTTATVSAGTNPLFIVFDPLGKYVFVANVGSKSITEFTVHSDATLGTTGNSITIPSVPQALVLTK
jgi:6-phosphogluconolactonase (cycloisomerase 2 family)